MHSFANACYIGAFLAFPFYFSSIEWAGIAASPVSVPWFHVSVVKSNFQCGNCGYKIEYQAHNKRLLWSWKLFSKLFWFLAFMCAVTEFTPPLHVRKLIFYVLFRKIVINVLLTIVVVIHIASLPCSFYPSFFLISTISFFLSFFLFYFILHILIFTFFPSPLLHSVLICKRWVRHWSFFFRACRNNKQLFDAVFLYVLFSLQKPILSEYITRSAWWH
jgi:hypothetical protein